MAMGWEKMAFWSTKAAVSLKRVKTAKKLLWGPIGTHLSSFERFHPSSQDWGFAPHPKLQSLLSQERVKLRISNLASTFRGSIRTKAHLKF